MIKQKNARVATEWSAPELDQTLRAIVNASAAHLYLRSNKDLVLSCIYRTPDEDKALYHDPNHEPGVHCYWRGADISIYSLTQDEIIGIANTVNSIWLYDPARPHMQCAVIENSDHHDSSAPHIHCQSHPNTTPIVHLAFESGTSAS